jgi:hypothetical protein
MKPDHRPESLQLIVCALARAEKRLEMRLNFIEEINWMTEKVTAE